MNALLRLPSHLRARLVAALESGAISSPCTPLALRSVLGPGPTAEAADAALAALAGQGITGRAAAAWLRGAEAASAEVRHPDLVWSGPEVPGLHARDTRRVYEELLGVSGSPIIPSRGN
jgi:hypothetical protein